MNLNTTQGLFAEILAQDNILLSVNSGNGICEARVEEGLTFRIREKWATIGDESGPWHIHLNMQEVKQAKASKRLSEPRQPRFIRLWCGETVCAKPSFRF